MLTNIIKIKKDKAQNLNVQNLINVLEQLVEAGCQGPPGGQVSRNTCLRSESMTFLMSHRLHQSWCVWQPGRYGTGSAESSRRKLSAS